MKSHVVAPTVELYLSFLENSSSAELDNLFYFVHD